MTARHRDLDNLSHRLDRAANLVPEIHEHLQEQRGHVSILAANTADAGPHGNGDHGDPVARIVLLLNEIDHRQRGIDDAVATLQVCVRMLEQECRSALSYRAPAAYAEYEPDDTPRCIGSSAGVTTGCDQIPVPRSDRSGLTIDDGRCLDCGRSYDSVQASRRQERAYAERMRYHRRRAG